jgi:hypothetical protein
VTKTAIEDEDKNTEASWRNIMVLLYETRNEEYAILIEAGEPLGKVSPSIDACIRLGTDLERLVHARLPNIYR